MERLITSYYRNAGVVTEIRACEFLPICGTAVKPHELVTFFPGWSLRAESKSVEGLGQNLADFSGTRTLTIDTKVKQIVPDSLNHQSGAVRQFIEAQKLEGITILGHSEGGIDAVNLAVQLQETNPEIKIHGVGLLDPVGIYCQSKANLVRRFMLDSLLMTPRVVVDRIANKPSDVSAVSVVSQALTLANEIALGIWEDMKLAGNPWQYVTKRLSSQVGEMAAFNPRMGAVRSPVVLIQGAFDLVSDPNHPNFQDDSWGIRLFPNSSSITGLKAVRLGSHALPLLRGKTVARVATHLLK